MKDKLPTSETPANKDLVKDALGPKYFAPINPNYSSSFDEATGCDKDGRGGSPECGTGEAEDASEAPPVG